MNKPRGWRNESGRHALAARGIRTNFGAHGVVAESMTTTQISDYYENFKNHLYYHIGGLASGVVKGDIDSMQEFVTLADEVVEVAEDLGLGREKFIKNIRTARDHVDKALGNDNYMYKYLKVKRNLSSSWGEVFDSKPYTNMARDDMDRILYELDSYHKFRNKIKNMELEGRIFQR